MSMAGRTQVTAGICKVAPVYTPPQQQRGHGYGTAATARPKTGSSSLSPDLPRRLRCEGARIRIAKGLIYGKYVSFNGELMTLRDGQIECR